MICFTLLRQNQNGVTEKEKWREIIDRAGLKGKGIANRTIELGIRSRAISEQNYLEK